MGLFRTNLGVGFGDSKLYSSILLLGNGMSSTNSELRSFIYGEYLAERANNTSRNDNADALMMEITFVSRIPGNAVSPSAMGMTVEYSLSRHVYSTYAKWSAFCRQGGRPRQEGAGLAEDGTSWHQKVRTVLFGRLISVMSTINSKQIEYPG